MKINLPSSLGWLVAGAALALLAFAGFTQPAEKSGVVDLNKVIQESALGKANTEKLRAALEARRQLIEFCGTYQVLTSEQAARLRELSLKENRTPAEQQELDRIRADVQASDRRRIELSQKQQPTDQDLAVLQDFRNRSMTMQRTLERWQMEFNQELDQLQERYRTETINRAREAVRAVASAQGYTLVFETTVVPYGANDITTAVIERMNQGQ